MPAPRDFPPPLDHFHASSVEMFLLMLALALRNMRKHSSPSQDLALDVTDAIHNRLDFLTQPEAASMRALPRDIEASRRMAQHLVHLLMEPGFADADLEK